MVNNLKLRPLYPQERTPLDGRYNQNGYFVEEKYLMVLQDFEPRTLRVRSQITITPELWYLSTYKSMDVKAHILQHYPKNEVVTLERSSQ